MKNLDNNFVTRMQNILHSINDTTQQNNIFNSNIIYLKDFNDNLIENYTYSLNVIVELFNMVFQYMEYLDTLELMVNDLNANSRNIIVNDIFTKYKTLNSSDIIALTSSFMNKIDELLPLFDKNGINKLAIEDFAKSVNNIQNLVKINKNKLDS